MSDKLNGPAQLSPQPSRPTLNGGLMLPGSAPVKGVPLLVVDNGGEMKLAAVVNGESESEAAFLGCLLIATADERAEILARATAAGSAELFYEYRHREIFSTIKDKHEAGAVDVPVVCDSLKAQGLLESVGGREYVSGLAEKSECAANFSTYLDKLVDLKTRRDALEQLCRRARDIFNPDVAADEIAAAVVRDGESLASGVTVEKRLRFHKPSDLRKYEPPKDAILVGDNHIVRGAVALIAGPPGIGKSRAATALAVSGATGAPWFGLPVHSRFKTVIIQNENGLFRLKTEYEALPHALDSYVLVSEPPADGMAFDHPAFVHELAAMLKAFEPQVVIVDPWNSVALDDGHRDYREAFRLIQSALPKGADAPALVIVAHCRKPRDGERFRGRTLLHSIAGHHVLTSVPRSAWVMEPATDDATDDRVIWSNVKCNDGPMADRSAWVRGESGFTPCADFDWDEFDNPEPERRGITADHLDEVFQGGTRRIVRKIAIAELMELTGCEKSAAYNALDLTKGRFRAHLSQDNGGLLTWTR